MPSEQRTAVKGLSAYNGNYAGDNMNVALAIKKAAVEGIVVKTVGSQ
ncbi:hypothetical protein NT01EI_1227 [Edwardsiella ictaluri 93-146]|uniref:DhaK domain-containing protein n=1 Tax=Edwardsiella ictaluri (strain 93-146) TaxID=634503 RepID=C5B7C9_EDWI9|nr:hypothetical protein NT01EI_1227 [Edwardsiella ictaluri 93-146]